MGTEGNYRGIPYKYHPKEFIECLELVAHEYTVKIET
jgi:hypothetical protein